MTAGTKSSNIWTKIRSRLPLLMVVLGVVAVVALAAAPWQKQENPPTVQPPTNVEIMKIETLPQMADVVELPGVIEANRVVNVAAEVNARIEHFHAEEGQRVTQGQLLVTLNKDLLEAEVEQKRAQSEFDVREVERLASLQTAGAATSNEVDLARTKAAASAAGLASARAQLARTEIFAPIDGVLNDLPMQVGEYAMPGKAVAQIVEVDVAKVVVEAPERDVSYLAVGHDEQIIPGRGGKPINGVISFISELADEKTRTSRVEILVDNRQQQLRSGQVVRVRLTRQTLEDVVLIPLNRVIPVLREGERHTSYIVYVMNNDKAHERPVKLGLMTGTSVQVVEGLKPGEKLILEGHRYVSDGQPVAVVAQVDAKTAVPQLADPALRHEPTSRAVSRPSSGPAAQAE